MKQELKARFARLGPILTIDRVRSGSPADIVIRVEGSRVGVRTIDAVHALVRRGVAARVAKRAVEDMLGNGEAVVEVPTVEPGDGLALDLRAAGIGTKRIKRLPPANVKAIREHLGMSAAAFAKRFNLNQRTIEGWEQGRPIDEVANTYLHVIAANPEIIERSLEEQVG